MTKTLTEQWRKGTLPVGSYYINLVGDVERVDFFGGLEWERTKYFGIEEVLAPVPSFDKVKEMSQKIERLEFDNEALEMAHNEGNEINAELVSKTDKLEKQLAIAKKALKEYERCENGSYAHKALALIKEVK